MSEIEDEMNQDQDETGGDRFELEIHGDAVWVVRSLAAPEPAEFVKSFAGPERLMRAVDEVNRLNRLTDLGIQAPAPLAAPAPAVPDTLRRTLADLDVALAAAGRQISVAFTAAREALAAAKRAQETALSAPLRGENASWVDEDTSKVLRPLRTFESGFHFHAPFASGRTVSTPACGDPDCKAAHRISPRADWAMDAIGYATRGPRCACGASSQLPHDCETSGRIS